MNDAAPRAAADRPESLPVPLLDLRAQYEAIREEVRAASRCRPKSRAADTSTTSSSSAPPGATS